MATHEHDPTYVAGYNDGFRKALRELRDGLDSLADEDGSLSGGDCVDYVYRMFDRLGIEALDEDDGLCEFAVKLPRFVFTDDDGEHIMGPRDELLLLARTIHDVIEGDDVDTNPTE